MFVVGKAPANFTVETFGAGDGDLTLAAKGPNDVDYKVWDQTQNALAWFIKKIQLI